MTDNRKRIEDIEARAAESELIAKLAADEEVRVYNRRLAVEPEYAARLRAPEAA